MIVAGTTSVKCPGCGQSRECELVQSINTLTNPGAVDKLLDGSLNVLACDCGRRTTLEANVLFHDPERDYYAQVVPGGDVAMARAGELFAAAGATGTQRLVPTLNALVEKVKLLRAGLEDWAIEMMKVLLLASIGELDRVLLFDRVDGDVIRWVLFDEDGQSPESVSSPLSAYTRLAARTPPRGERRIDRAWAIEAVKAMIAAAN